MRIVFILILFTNLLYGCNSAAKPGVDNEIKETLHFALNDTLTVDPMTLLSIRDSYYLIYQAIDSNLKKQNTFIASSKDLLNWRELHQIDFGNNLAVVKGTMVIDSINNSGLDTFGNSILVAVLAVKKTLEDSSRAILATSRDEGKSWGIAGGDLNFPQPFLQHPQNVNIAWFATEKKWIMTVALQDHVEFFSSKNLRSWTFESAMGSDFFPEAVKWERAVLFPDRDNDHWVLLADITRMGKQHSSGGTVYFVGFFDGNRFQNLSGKLRWMDYGENVYASLVNVSDDGRRVNMAWKNAGNGYSRFVSIPRQIWVDNAGDEKFMFSKPIDELDSMFSKTTTVAPLHISYKNKPATLVSGIKTPIEIYLKFNSRNIQKGSFPTKFGISFSNAEVESGQFSFLFDRFGYYYIEKSMPNSAYSANNPAKMPFEHLDSTFIFHIIVDASTIECFAEDGRLVMTDTYSLRDPINTIKLFAEKGDIDFMGGRVIELKTSSR